MKLRAILLILALLSLVSVSAGGYLYYASMKKSSLERDHQEGMIRTQLIADHIDSFLSERQKTVKAFAGLKELHQALANKDESKTSEANMILDHFQKALNVDVCYLMDEQGNTVASSNRNAPDSFVGKNYAFRPYFQEAKQGNPAIYMALGATSGKRGVYFSHPVYGELNELPSGVVVVKDSNQATEKEISRGYEGVMLFTDPHGVIFVSSRENWLFQVLWRVSSDEIAKIAKTRQFGDGPLNWTGLERENETHAIDKSGIEYYIHQTEIKNYPGWKVVYLHDSRSVMNKISGPFFKTAGLIIFISCLIVGLAVLFLYREAANVIVLRKKAEEARQKEKEFSDSLVKSLPGVFYLFDEKKLLFHRWNHNFENVTGYSSSEIAEMSPLELFDEHEGASVAESIRQVFEKGYATVEAAFLTKKGDRIPYFFTGHALKIEEETYLIGMGIDVSERKQAEEALQKSEGRYKTLFEEALDGICIADAKTGVIIDCNQALTALVGRERAELIGQSQTILHPPYADQGALSHTFRQHLTDKEGQTVETQVLTSNGTIREVEIKANRLDLRGRKALQGVFRDITERKRAEEALRESEALYRLHFDNVSDVIYSVDREFNLINLSPSVQRVLGYKPEELIGRPFQELNLLAPEYLEQAASETMRILEGERIPSSEYQFIARDGIKKWGEVSGAPLVRDGRVVALISVARDITERKRAEEENEKLQAQLRQSQKMEAIGTLAGGVAHDFNNLLTSIIGNADLGLMDLGKDHPLREGIEDIKKAANSAASLTRQLLAFSRRQVIKPEVLDINEVITSTEKMLKRLIGEDVELSRLLEPELWQVHADQGQIEQVIMNLTVNARDAMPQGGQITIETANMDLGGDYFRKHGIEEQPGSYVMLSVSDTGIGMDKETQARIFEPFFTTKGVGKGTGLGLSTVYGIVKQSKGNIWVYSEPGQGTTFKIYLPKAKKDVEPEKKERTPVIKLAGSETVLVVEDDESLRKLVQKSIQPHGYRVLMAENGEDALRISKEHEGPIDLLITDVVMPRMGGKEVAERLQPLYPRMKVIYMSGYTDEAIVHHGVLVPGLNFLEKPFSPEGLARKVREVLGVGIEC